MKHIGKFAAVGISAAAVLTMAACSGSSTSSSSSSSEAAPASAGASAPAESPAAAGLTVGVSFDKFDDAFRVGEKKYLDKFATENGITLVYQDAQQDAQKQSSQIQSFISQGVDGIVMIPWDTQAVAADIKAAADAGIPLAIIDQAPADTADVFYYAGGNPESDGKMAGEFLVKEADGQPLKVLELQGSLNNQNGLLRSKGFQDAIAGASNIELVGSAPVDWKADKALAAVQNALLKDPDIGAIYAAWTGALPSIYSALEAVGKTAKVGEDGHVITMSINGDELGCKYVGDNSNDLDIATPVPDMAAGALQAIIDAKNGVQPATAVNLLPGVPYAPGDFETTKALVWGCN